MNAFLEFVIDLIYPPRCSFCRKIIERKENGICSACMGILPLLKGTEQKRMLENGIACYTPLKYDSTVRDSFLRYKFYGFVSYAETYSKLLAACIEEQSIECDLVTWVPLSRKRKKKRGYDQAELLAEGISSLLGLDCKKILYKNRETKAQSLTNDHKERKQNVKGVYSLKDGERIEGKKILLIDDIVTTGATLSECGAVLIKEGAASVAAVALASAAK